MDIFILWKYFSGELEGSTLPRQFDNCFGKVDALLTPAHTTILSSVLE